MLVSCILFAAIILLMLRLCIVRMIFTSFFFPSFFLPLLFMYIFYSVLVFVLVHARSEYCDFFALFMTFLRTSSFLDQGHKQILTKIFSFHAIKTVSLSFLYSEYEQNIIKQSYPKLQRVPTINKEELDGFPNLELLTHSSSLVPRPWKCLSSTGKSLESRHCRRYVVYLNTGNNIAYQIIY